MLSTLMVLAATAAIQSGSAPTWQDDPHKPWVIGPWRLTCRRDGNFTGWNHVEGCGASASVGSVRLSITRTAREAFTLVTIDGCPPTTGLSNLSVRALNKTGSARVQLLHDALRRTMKAAVDRCGAGPDLKGFVVRDSDIAVILKGSDGLKDES